MYFTPDGLEQATRLPVAAHRAGAGRDGRAARRCSTSAAASAATCVALARAGLTVAGIDRDELRVEVARANLAALGLGGAVQVAAAEDVDASPGSAWSSPTPPVARPGGGSFNVDGWSPPWPSSARCCARPRA